MDRIANIKACNIDLKYFRDRRCGRININRVTHNVQDAAAFQARRFFFIDEPNRDLDVDPCFLINAHHVDMERKALDRINLDIPRNHRLQAFLALHIDIGETTAHAASLIGVVDLVEAQLDRHRIAAAIEHARHPAIAANRARAACACSIPGFAIEYVCFSSHDFQPSCEKGRVPA